MKMKDIWAKVEEENFQRDILEDWLALSKVNELIYEDEEEYYDPIGEYMEEYYSQEFDDYVSWDIGWAEDEVDVETVLNDRYSCNDNYYLRDFFGLNTDQQELYHAKYHNTWGYYEPDTVIAPNTILDWQHFGIDSAKIHNGVEIAYDSENKLLWIYDDSDYKTAYHIGDTIDDSFLVLSCHKSESRWVAGRFLATGKIQWEE